MTLCTLQQENEAIPLIVNTIFRFLSVLACLTMPILWLKKQHSGLIELCYVALVEKNKMYFMLILFIN